MKMAPVALPAKRPVRQAGDMTMPTVRRILLDDLSDLPTAWYGDDVHVTTFWNALSAAFPEGENFFVRAVRAHRSLIDDDVLRERLDAFVGQEAAHGVGHRAFNRAVARSFPSMPRVDRDVRFILKKLAPVLFNDQQQLAVTCALEHFTSILASQLLEDARHRGACLHDGTTRLWMWHAFEELEHEDVAFDVYMAAGGNAFERRWIMLVTTVLFGLFVAYFYAVLARDRGEHLRVSGWARVFGFLWFRPGLTRRLLPDYLRYFRRDFHPRDKGKAALLAVWRERLFGDDGEVRVDVRSAA